jgi:OPA family sugar phosphate sensor protein UhpC-like MFS transporter
MSSVLWTFALFWGLNGWFQGWGWPGCAKLLTHWYSQSERGRWWSIWNTAHNLGGALIPLLVPSSICLFGWRYAMFVPGILCILVGLSLICCLRDTPQSMGLPPIEKFRDDYPNKQLKNREEETLSTREIFFEFILRNRSIWLLSFAYFFTYIIRMAVNDWSMLYLIEVKGYTSLAAGFCVCWFEVGGFFGSLAAGWGSDLLFQGRRNPINVLFSLAILFLIVGFKASTIATPFLDASFLFLFGFFIFGPQMLIGMAAAELSHKKAAATATGFAGGFAYLGAAVAGAPLGAITKHWGWDSFLLTLFVCACSAALLLLPLWSIRANPKEEEPANT